MGCGSSSIRSNGSSSSGRSSCSNGSCSGSGNGNMVVSVEIHMT